MVARFAVLQVRSL